MQRGARLEVQGLGRALTAQGVQRAGETARVPAKAQLQRKARQQNGQRRQMAQHKGEQHKPRGRPVAGEEHQPQHRHHHHRRQPAQHRRPGHPALPGLGPPDAPRKARQPGQKAAAEHARPVEAQVNGGQPHQRPEQSGQHRPQSIGHIDRLPDPEAEQPHRPDQELRFQPNPAGEGSGPGPGGQGAPPPAQAHHAAPESEGAAGEEEDEVGAQRFHLPQAFADKTRQPGARAVLHRQHHHGVFQPFGAGVHRLAGQKPGVGRQQRPVAPGRAAGGGQRHRIAQGRGHPAVLPEGEVGVAVAHAALAVGQNGKEHLPGGQRPAVVVQRVPRLTAQLGVLARRQGRAVAGGAARRQQRAVVE